MWNPSFPICNQPAQIVKTQKHSWKKEYTIKTTLSFIQNNTVNIQSLFVIDFLFSYLAPTNQCMFPPFSSRLYHVFIWHEVKSGFVPLRFLAFRTLLRSFPLSEESPSCISFDYYYYYYYYFPKPSMKTIRDIFLKLWGLVGIDLKGLKLRERQKPTSGLGVIAPFLKTLFPL